MTELDSASWIGRRVQGTDRPKPWRARYRTPDGRRVSKSFRRKGDAEKWLVGRGDLLLAGARLFG